MILDFCLNLVRDFMINTDNLILKEVVNVNQGI